MEQINQIVKPHIGKVIKRLREYRGMSQEALAHAGLFNRTTLSQIELGKLDCPDDLLMAIKTALNVELLPLLETERLRYKDMLYSWYDVISEYDTDTAKEMYEKLSIIKLLPHDIELNTLFVLFECRLMLWLNKFEDAKAIIDMLESRLDELSDIQRYHYFYVAGTFHIKNKRNEEALVFYTKALELTKYGLEKSIPLYYNIALCCQRLGFVARTITLLEEACKLHTIGNNTTIDFRIYNLLGKNYMKMGNFQRAKIFLDKAYVIALSNCNANENKDTKAYVGIVLLNYGFMFRMSKEWHSAFEYFDKAITYLDKGDANYLETIYQKVRSLIEMKNPLSCMALLVEGVHLAKNSEVYTVMFEALKLMINLNDKSAEELETTVLPYLLKNEYIYPALDYAMFLRDYYKTKSKGFKIRALEMSDLICSIYSKMLVGGVT